VFALLLFPRCHKAHETIAALDKSSDKLTIPKIREPPFPRGALVRNEPKSEITHRETIFRKDSMRKLCRHPRVRVVAREEDVEFVECQECGDVFESSEFKDMAIEENIPEENIPPEEV
jgi:hypothetical protein